MNLELSDAETEALIHELSGTINYARYPLSPRIQTLRAIFAKLTPEPAREPLPPPMGLCAAAGRRSQKTAPRVKSKPYPRNDVRERHCHAT